jgi:hypothetical protein
VDDGLTLAIPFVTGPVNQGLSITVTDHRSGAVLAQIVPPVLGRWKLWEPHLPKGHTLSLDIYAGDRGSGWGQWLAVGLPRVFDQMFTQMGPELPTGSMSSDGAWSPDGYYPAVGAPPVGGSVYGSWSGSDTYIGNLHLGPIRVRDETAIGIPLVTGPNNAGLAIHAVDTRTGKVLASLNPVPVHISWRVWRIELPRESDTSLEIVAEDHGAHYGQWLAIGAPHALHGAASRGCCNAGQANPSPNPSNQR